MRKQLSDRQHAHLYRRVQWADLDAAYLQGLIKSARAEDVEGLGFAEGVRPGVAYAVDATSELLPAGSVGKATLVFREEAVVCGMELAPMVLAAYDKGLELHNAVADGTRVKKGEAVGELVGPVSALLTAERVTLNFLQRLSGVATATARYVSAMGDTETRLLDTRKTTPGFRALEKYAFACGGGWNHRLGLYDRIMLKDNHLAAAGWGQGSPLRDAVLMAKQRRPDLVVEAEVDAMEQIPPLLEAGVDVILLDNFSPEQCEKAVRLIDGRALTEASGGIKLDTIGLYARVGVDFISTGAPVHHAAWCDIGLDWD